MANNVDPVHINGLAQSWGVTDFVIRSWAKKANVDIKKAYITPNGAQRIGKAILEGPAFGTTKLAVRHWMEAEKKATEPPKPPEPPTKEVALPPMMHVKDLAKAWGMTDSNVYIYAKRENIPFLQGRCKTSDAKRLAEHIVRSRATHETKLRVGEWLAHDKTAKRVANGQPKAAPPKEGALELGACPLCGSPSGVFVIREGAKYKYKIGCTSCWLETPSAAIDLSGVLAWKQLSELKG